MSSSLSSFYFNFIERFTSFSGIFNHEHNISLSSICNHILSLSVEKVSNIKFSALNSIYLNFTCGNAAVTNIDNCSEYYAIPSSEPISSEEVELTVATSQKDEISDFLPDHNSSLEFASKDDDDNWDDLTFDDSLFNKSICDENEPYDVEPSSSISTFQLAPLPSGMPEIPPYFIERKDLTLQLLKRLRAATPQMFIVVSDSRSSLRSGTGKSLLVAATIGLEEVRRLYNGGIFWLHVGAASFDEVQMFNLIRKLARDVSISLTGAPLFSSSSIGASVNNLALSNVNHLCASWDDSPVPSCLNTIETYCAIIRDILQRQQKLHSLESLASSPNVLLILDNAHSDKLLHYLKDVGFVIVVTTRFPNVFAEGRTVGSMLCIAEPTLDFSTKLLSSVSHMESSQSLPAAAVSVCQLTSNLLELAMLGVMAVERASDSNVWNKISRRLANSCDFAQSAWIDALLSMDWVSPDALRNRNLFCSIRLSLRGLDANVQHYYAALVVIPKDCAFDRDLLGVIWGVGGRTLTAIISLLVMRGLLAVRSHPSGRRYTLSDIHVDYLAMDAKHRLENAPRASSSSKASPPLVLARVQHAVDSMVHLLTGPDSREGQGQGDGMDRQEIHSMHFDYCCWKRLMLLGDLGICTPVRPAECFQSRIDYQMATCDAGDMLGYVAYACHMLELLRIFHPVLNIWYRTSLDFLEREGRGEGAQTASLLNSLGQLFMLQGKFAEAVDVFLKAAVLLEGVFGPKHLNVASTYVNIGLSLKALGCAVMGAGISQHDNDDASYMFRKALVIATDLAAEWEDPRVARYLCGLSALLFRQAMYKEAVTGYSIAVSIFEKVLGTSDTESIIARGELGIALIHIGDEIGGKSVIEECIASLRLHGYGEPEKCIQKLKKFLRDSSLENDSNYFDAPRLACVC